MKRLTNEEVRVDESMDRYLGPLSVLEGMKPKLLDLILNGPVLNGVSQIFRIRPAADDAVEPLPAGIPAGCWWAAQFPSTAVSCWSPPA